jgi:hypothetical protein
MAKEAAFAGTSPFFVAAAALYPVQEGWPATAAAWVMTAGLCSNGRSPQ